MDRCDADAGHLILFDRRDLSWEEKMFHEMVDCSGRAVAVWGM